jgi:hypothetical protein
MVTTAKPRRPPPALAPIAETGAEQLAADGKVELPSGAELMMLLAEMRADIDKLLKKDKAAAPRGYCNLKAAAFESGFAGETIRLWCIAGAVRARRFGGQWLVRLADVKARRRFGHLDAPPKPNRV